MTVLPEGLIKFITESLQIAPAVIPLPDTPLVLPSRAAREGGIGLYGTEIARAYGGIPSPNAWAEDPQSPPKGYFLIGCWGHGLNSYRFVYLRADEQFTVNLDLIFGGAYGDQCKLVGQFLNAFFRCEAAIRPFLRHLTALDDGEMGRYRLEFLDGQVRQHDDTLFECHFGHWYMKPKMEELFLGPRQDGRTGGGTK